jgi:hypothetical protein
MSINFPSNPTASQTYTFNGSTWTYNGYAWNLSATNIGGTGPQGILGPQGLTGPIGDTGTQGYQGPTGPIGIPGQSSNFYDYQGKTSSTSGNPTTGYLIWNNLTQINSTQININHIDSDGDDIDIFLILINTGDIIIIQDRDNSANYQKWQVSAPITAISNIYVEVPVSYVIAEGTGFTNFVDNEELLIALISKGSTGPQGITGPQGNTGPSGESTVVLLTDGASIATDASLGNVFYVTLGGNRTLSNPTNPTSGKRIIWRIKQDATGGRTITLDNKFRLGTDITSVVLSTAPSITDYIGAIYNAQDDKWDVIAFVKGFA